MAKTKPTEEQFDNIAETGIVADGSDTATDSNTVFVFANLPRGIVFRLKDKTSVKVEGVPVSSLRSPSGGFLRGGRYAITRVDRQKWEEIKATYSKMSPFQNSLIFAADTVEEGQKKIRDLTSLRHGFEQIDPKTSNKVKSEQGKAE